MARGDQLSRQWEILQILLQARGGKSAAELAENLECHPRTVYRDLEALLAAGFPIYYETVRGKNLWSVLDTLKFSIPVPFTLSELIALHLSRDILKVLKGTVFCEALESLFRKVRNLLPPDSQAFLTKAEKTVHARLGPYKELGRYREMINQAQEAALQGKVIEIVYYTMSRRELSKRKVDPYKILFCKGAFYLVGFCHQRQKERMFAISRIKMLHQTGEKVSRPAGDFILDDYLRQSFTLFQGEPHRVKVWFAPEVAGYIEERIWHESQEMIREKDGSLIFEAEVAGLEEIQFWLRSWGSKAVVLEPELLREAMQKEAALVITGYSVKSQARAHGHLPQ